MEIEFFIFIKNVEVMVELIHYRVQQPLHNVVIDEEN
jgi:hypothetical protein